MKIVKILAILAVSALSLFAAVYFTELYVSEVNAKEKTLAQIIMQNQLEAEMNKAEEQAKEELGEALVTTVLETKPPVITTTVPVTITVTTTTTVTTTAAATTPAAATSSSVTTLPPEEEINTEFTRGGILPEDRRGIPIKTIFTLTEGEQQRFTEYLIGHYFLNGDIYVKNETRPALKEKKAVANEMEKSAIAALNLVLENVSLSDITTIMTADYSYIGGEIKKIRDIFSKNYSNSAEYGENYKKLYDESLLFLDRLIEAVEKLEKASREYSESTNIFLAGIVLARTVEEVIIPEIMAVLEQSFGLVEITQEIFLEGTQGTRLLSREEVSDAITNPALVLDTGLA